MNIRNLLCLSANHYCLNTSTNRRFYYGVPFLDLYRLTTGQSMSKYRIEKIKQKYPNIEGLSKDQLQCTLQILQKFNITAMDAFQNVHVFTMNPITMDNYGEILRECGFIKIEPQHIIKYHTFVKSRTIAQLKKMGLMRSDIQLEQTLLDCLKDWPTDKKTVNITDVHTNILKVRMSVLEKYLEWRLEITTEEFEKYCRNYLPLKHKPLSDIQEALDIAENDIRFDLKAIRRNGFVISSDPVHTKLIIDNVESLAGMDIREVIKLEPAILKNNYNALLQIRDLLEEFRIPFEAQKRCLRVYCMQPKTVRERLDELKTLKEYQVLATNPRVLTMVVHKKKMMNRLNKMQAVKKQCYSLNHLIASSKVFNHYISSFGNKVCGRDIAILISTSLDVCDINGKANDEKESPVVKTVLKRLRRHKYWLHCALHVIHENIQFLKKKFGDQIIFNNCQLLLYPVNEVQRYINMFIEVRDRGQLGEDTLDANYNNLKYKSLTDDQILSLVLYEMEKKYHFSGDGVWARLDGVKIDAYGTGPDKNDYQKSQQCSR